MCECHLHILGEKELVGGGGGVKTMGMAACWGPPNAWLTGLPVANCLLMGGGGEVRGGLGGKQ